MSPPIQLQRLPRRKKPAQRKRASLLIALALSAVALLALAGCSKADAHEPQPTPAQQRLARAAAMACEGLTPVFDDGRFTCVKERP